VSARLERSERNITPFVAINHHANKRTATRAVNHPIASMQSAFDRCRHRRRQT
jgi:hypothetical protein